MADAAHFEVGDEVEVTSPIHNMRGTTFPAKIVAKSRTKSKLKVEYNRVKARIDRKISGGHKGGNAALREEVDAALLRPPPPRESDYRFKLGDVVDAFFCGGWWEGVVVSDVLVDNTLGVYFRFAKEKFEFEPEELRLHREWVKGSWVPPLQQGDVLDAKEPKTGMNEELIEGTTVEVCTDEDGFQGAWFAANIVKVMEKDKFFVRYKTIKTDDNKELLMEEVDAKHIRPRPPKVVAAESFSLTEEVDAFYNDGWWEGVIRKVLPGRRYKVYFKGTDDELLFQHSDLRPRQDWMDRTWVMASQLALRSIDVSGSKTCFVCTILDQSRNYRAPANAILSRTQKSSPPTRRPITTRHVSRLEANQSAARVDIKNQSQHDTCQCDKATSFSINRGHSPTILPNAILC